MSMVSLVSRVRDYAQRKGVPVAQAFTSMGIRKEAAIRLANLPEKITEEVALQCLWPGGVMGRREGTIEQLNRYYAEAVLCSTGDYYAWRNDDGYPEQFSGSRKHPQEGIDYTASLLATEMMRILGERSPVILNPGDPIPLRAGEKLPMGGNLTWVEGFNRADIPHILKILGSQADRVETFDLPSGAKLSLSARLPGAERMGVIVTYNDQVIYRPFLSP